MPVIPVLTAAEAAAWDRRAEADGIALGDLMASAGEAVACFLLDRHATPARQGVLVASGPGHNGGDGWVAARALQRRGVAVWVVEAEGARAPLTIAAREAALADGVRTLAPDGPWPDVGIVVDALLGTGAKGAPRGAIATLLGRLADLHRPIVTVDGPTGLDLDVGVSHGALPAAMSVTFGGPRRGHLLARDEVGDLLVAEIGLPAADPSWPRLLEAHWAAAHLGPLPARSHKGSRGRVVIVGGQDGMTGAARLAARAAFAGGAGLVHVVQPEDAATTLRVAEPDTQLLVHDFTAPLAPALVALLDRADVTVIGPGLGRAEGRRAFVLAVLERSRRAVVDADALVVLRGEQAALRQLAASRTLVLTPHIGEFRTLFPECSHSLETDPWSAAVEASAASGATVLLKGVPTVIASPGAAPCTVAAGNPGLATGGSGDILAGLVGTFLAQQDSAVAATGLAALALGEAAVHAARRTSARSMRPTDTIAALPQVWRLWGRDVPSRPPILVELPAPQRH